MLYARGVSLIATRALTKRFGSIVALDSLDLEVEPGVIGLVGANGAGKSTLIKILLGLTAPTSGSAEMFGLDVDTHGLSIRQLIGYMPEHDCLPLEISATEFVAHMARVNGLPRAAARERTAETLRHVGLYEERYREMRGYSTGMRQRVKLAQALVHDPKLMLLDEPTNGLDPAGRDEMLDLVRRIGTRVRDLDPDVLAPAHGDRARLRLPPRDRRWAPDPSRRPGDVHGPHGVLSVEVDGSVGDLADLLRERGYDVQETSTRTLAIDHGDDGAYDAIRDGAASLELGLIRIEQRRQHLEDLFRDEAVDEVATRV